MTNNTRQSASRAAPASSNSTFWPLEEKKRGVKHLTFWSIFTLLSNRVVVGVEGTCAVDSQDTHKPCHPIHLINSLSLMHIPVKPDPSD